MGDFTLRNYDVDQYLLYTSLKNETVDKLRHIIQRVGVLFQNFFAPALFSNDFLLYPFW